MGGTRAGDECGKGPEDEEKESKDFFSPARFFCWLSAALAPSSPLHACFIWSKLFFVIVLFSSHLVPQ